MNIHPVEAKMYHADGRHDEATAFHNFGMLKKKHSLLVA